MEILLLNTGHPMEFYNYLNTEYGKGYGFYYIEVNVLVFIDIH